MGIWFSQMDTENVKTSVRGDKQLFSKQSEYQRIDVFESREFGRMIVLDGEIIFSEADEFIYNEMVVHVPMAVHPHVKNVLIIGGGDGGVAKVLTQYPEIESIDVVEPDEMFIEVSREFFPESAKGFDDERVKITNMDGLRFFLFFRPVLSTSATDGSLDFHTTSWMDAVSGTQAAVSWTVDPAATFLSPASI